MAVPSSSGPVVQGIAIFVVSHFFLGLGKIPAGACDKVTSDLGLGDGFCRLLRFPPPLTTG